jgi:hypothetical protein
MWPAARGPRRCHGLTRSPSGRSRRYGRRHGDTSRRAPTSSHRWNRLSRPPSRRSQADPSRTCRRPTATGQRRDRACHLPITAIDLNDLAVDRLRRFLDAFHIEIHYDPRTRRATVRAEISAEFVDRLAQAVGWAGRPRSGRSETKDEDGPPTTAGPTKRSCTVMGCAPGRIRPTTVHPADGSRSLSTFRFDRRVRLCAPAGQASPTLSTSSIAIPW